MRNTLGLHTKAERDYAKRIADAAYKRGEEAAGREDLAALSFEIGMLHAIALLAEQEKQDELVREVTWQRSGLDRAAHRIREGHR
jgi:hypothetical protein